MKTPLFIDTVLRDTFLTVVQLRKGERIDHGDVLYQRCLQQVEQVRHCLEEAQYSDDSIDHILYAQCALLDETVLSGRTGIEETAAGYDRWIRTPLQAHYFNTLEAGEQLYKRIRRLLNDPTADVAVLTCFHRVLSLGFQGCYTRQPQQAREQLFTALQERVAPFDVQTSGALLLNARRRRFTGDGWQSLWLWGVLSACTVVALWWGLDHQLATSLVELIGSGSARG